MWNSKSFTRSLARSAEHVKQRSIAFNSPNAEIPHASAFLLAQKAKKVDQFKSQLSGQFAHLRPAMSSIFISLYWPGLDLCLRL